MVIDRKKYIWIAELIVVLVLSQTFPRLVTAAAASIGIALPTEPLLERAYLYFVLTLLVFAWVWWRGEAFADFGLVVPRRWLRLIGQGFLIFLAIMVFDAGIRPFLDPLIAHITGASPTLAEQHFAPMRGHPGLLVLMVASGWLFGGLGEEMLNRGFIMTRIAQVLGQGRAAWIAAFVSQAIWFGFGHGYQGPVGWIAISVVGMIYAAGTLIWGRNLWPAIVAHGLQDTLGFVALYTGLAHA